MSSDKSEDEQEAISKQIIDYYKKYSQSKHLPKYFSGSALSYMPPIVKEDEIVIKSPPIIIIDDTSSETLIAPQEIEPKLESPTSSVASKSKLEWDNGADIGYSNCTKSIKLQKSTSLPILLTAKSVDKKVSKKLSSQVVTVISYSSGDDNVEKVTQTSSSSSSPPHSANVPDSSSSSVQTNINPVSSSSSSYSNTIDYLKCRIGLPNAESTPKVQIYETPIRCSKKNKITNLCLTKPIVIHCLDTLPKKGSDKKIQTSFVEKSTKSIQTNNNGDLNDSCKLKKTVEKQSVILINYDSESDKKTCSSNTQTECESFEYYREHENVLEEQINSTESLRDIPKEQAISSESSKDLPVLGQLICEKQSQSIVGDIDRSITILQKLLKSKKYDSATKKHYIKKIVEKIIDTKYKDDSTSSSELFVPKTTNRQQISKFTVKTFNDEFLPNDNQIVKKDTPETTTSTDRTSDKIPNLSSGSYQSWKDDKTQSERILEQKQKGQGDYLVNFAKKERQHQLNWIKDEISHLTKLKGLLEKKTQRTTTVYMVSQQYSGTNETSSASGSQSNHRNYVIQTELTNSSSSDLPIEYNLYDKTGKKNYKIKELEAKPEMLNINRKVVGDIEVVSDDKTTNIKVKTKKVESKDSEFEPRPPVLVGKDKYDTFPRSKTEENKCWPCGKQKSTKQYSFDVPIDSQSSFATKLDEILNTRKMSCCQCLELLNTRLHAFKNRASSAEVKLEDSNSICRCCGPRNSEKIKLQTESTECQTDDCNCCQKQVQAGVSSKDEATNRDDCNCINKEVQTSNIFDKDESGETPPEDCDCSDKEIQTSKDGDCPCSSKQTTGVSFSSTKSSTSSSSETTSSESIKSCVCCKRKNVTSKRLYALRKQLSDQAYPLCRPCTKQMRKGVYSPNFYNNPTHICNCYTVVQTKTLNEIKKTINDLNDIDQYCSCVNIESQSSSEYCKYCKCKLIKTSRNKNGIAYMITFENEPIQEVKKKRKHKKKPYLEEIKIKIPVTYKKKHKDKENKKKKTKGSYESEETTSSGGVKKENYNLQEYLKTNRPGFVQEAEGRRTTVNESRKKREELADFNKLMFLKKCQEECEQNAKRLFSAKEMKEITRRNYKKLPEVQKKLNDNRDKQLRQASKLMADTFNRKLRDNVLKGKRNLPTDVKVINM